MALLYKLIIWWKAGTREVFTFKTLDKTERAEINLKTAYGNKIARMTVKHGLKEKEVMNNAHNNYNL